METAQSVQEHSTNEASQEGNSVPENHAPDRGEVVQKDDSITLKTQEISHEATNENQQSENAENKENKEPWFWDENKAGDSERPEWLNTKYKNVAEQAKAYNEAQKKLGAFKGAPKEYDLQHDDIKDLNLSADDPHLSDFLQQSKEQNVTQEYLNKILLTYKGIIQANKPDPQKELERLGPTAITDIKTLGKWADNNLSEQESKLLKSMLTTAESVRLFEKLRGVTNRADTAPTPSNVPRETLADVKSMIHDPRYDSDENFRSKVREKLKQFGS